MLEQRAGESAKLIEGRAEPAALPAPKAPSIGAGLEPKSQRRPNRLLMQADTAVGPAPRAHSPRGEHIVRGISPPKAETSMSTDRQWPVTSDPQGSRGITIRAMSLRAPQDDDYPRFRYAQATCRMGQKRCPLTPGTPSPARPPVDETGIFDGRLLENAGVDRGSALQRPRRRRRNGLSGGVKRIWASSSPKSGDWSSEHV